VNILLIKTSSLGDVVHALPAVTEATANVPDLRFDWVVEEGLTDIPVRHDSVSEVIPVAIRRWRDNWLGYRREISAAIRQIREKQYDVVIDSQGLIKSALLTAVARGEKHGYDKDSAREPMASLFYRCKHTIPGSMHAIQRQKQLFAASLGYQANQLIDYGLRSENVPNQQIMLLHGTTWESKEWPESHWQQLANLVREAGFELLVPAGSQTELARAGRIVGGGQGRILDRLPLGDLMNEIALCSGVVSVDTGLGHLAPALGVPAVGIFGSTNPDLTGIIGPATKVLVSNHLPCIPCRKRTCEFRNSGESRSIYPPCYEQTTPERVWQALQLQIGGKDTKPG
jgi:heptosyltransferase-1